VACSGLKQKDYSSSRVPARFLGLTSNGKSMGRCVMEGSLHAPTDIVALELVEFRPEAFCPAAPGPCIRFFRLSGAKLNGSPILLARPVQAHSRDSNPRIHCHSECRLHPSGAACG
jgi:hypothetical protein